jgi:hypothetical protein
MKKLLLLLLAYAVGGAIINVAVAWVGTWLQRNSVSHSMSESERASLWNVNAPQEWPRAGPMFGTKHVSGFTDYRVIGARPAHVSPQFTEVTSYIPRYDLIICDQGWPCRATRAMDFVCQDSETSPEMRWQRQGILLTSTDSRVFGLKPLWPGFAINTIFYAAILWLLFAAPGFVRRRLRVRRGQCPACAYPVGASDVCTECGAQLKSRNAETQKAEIT